jgi:predicted XRE-type DNA-binding protein
METITVHKTSEKVLIWMHRNKLSGQDVASEAGITRQGFSKMMSDNTFSVKVLMALKRLGYND